MNSIMPEQKWNFDEVIDRCGYQSIKWDFMNVQFCTDDLLPLWIADMDFRAPEGIISALQNKVAHGIYGYSGFPNSYYQAIQQWFNRRHQWNIAREWVSFSPGIVPAIHLIVQAFTSIGDYVVVQNPVYYPFFNAIEKNGRKILYNPLLLKNGHYEMDFSHLEKIIQENSVKLFILCSPHNPVGRVWKRDELERLGNLCLKYNVLVVADEIHCDLVFPGHKHIPFASISPEFAQNTIVCTATSKTFNLAGLQCSAIVIPNKEIKATFDAAIERCGISGPNYFAGAAVEAAYREGEPWLDAVLKYIYANYLWLVSFIKENVPQIRIIEPEGTYLLWLDFRQIEPDPKKLEELVQKQAKIGFDEGYIFGPGGEGFERINIACPRKTLEIAMNRIKDVVGSYLQKIYGILI